ncbi:MAG: HAD family phosphatase [Kofleriaceae bacterium]|nr:HAD family phosphatase [Kofleriaceae bacterium]
MQPVAELAGHAAELRGVFSDIDDTLTHGGVVELEAYAALVRARAAGLRVVLVTGRPGGWAEVLASVWPVDAAIAENGGVAFLRRHGRLERVYFEDGDPADDTRRLAAVADDILRTFPTARRADDGALRVTDVAFDVGEHQQVPAEVVAAMTTRMRALGARTLVSSVHAHAFFHGADKAQMSARVAGALWGEPAAEVAARYAFVGDSPNDQAAFAFFAHSIGVANVSRYAASLRPPPRYVTTAPYGRGFAEAIDVILRGRGPRA